MRGDEKSAVFFSLIRVAYIVTKLVRSLIVCLFVKLASPLHIFAIAPCQARIRGRWPP